MYMHNIYNIIVKITYQNLLQNRTILIFVIINLAQFSINNIYSCGTVTSIKKQVLKQTIKAKHAKVELLKITIYISSLYLRHKDITYYITS